MKLREKEGPRKDGKTNGRSEVRKVRGKDGKWKGK